MTTRIGTTQESSPERKLAPDTTTFNLPLGWRIGLSVALLLHLLAVFLPPFQFACRVGNGSSSPFADGLTAWFRPYIGAMYLDHGYFFFAPNPGPSHLVKYKVEFADDREPIEGRFPNLQEQQPRLKYHRHFMIAEALYNQYESPTAPPEPSPPPLNSEQTERDRRLHAERVNAHQINLRLWQFRRRQYDEMKKSLEEHLLHVHGGSKVTLTRVEHRLLSPFEASDLGLRPNDPATYVDLREAPATTPSGVNP
ncbi:hypothetical protein NA78x_005890 [Anatilimnocola sp. NA78]|uniref:hypothetical protein n=1 Tax=Anatilimnocola sp. NA78 TaxID=3415683 RepID=UPI003CE5A9D6